MGCGPSKIECEQLEIIKSKPDLIQNDFVQQKYFQELTETVRLISKPERVIAVLCIAENAFPLIACQVLINSKEIEGIQLPIVSASTLGNGKIICFGEIEFLSTELFDKYETPDFLLNCFKWGSTSKKKRVCISNIGFQYSDNLQSLLSSKGFKVISSEDFKQIDSCSIFVISSNYDFRSKNNYKKVFEFVKKGGCLICFACVNDSENGSSSFPNVSGPR